MEVCRDFELAAFTVDDVVFSVTAPGIGYCLVLGLVGKPAVLQAAL